MQLNTSDRLKKKLELARDLMSHANPAGDLAVVVERAVDLLIEKLQKQRFGQTSRPRRTARRQPNDRALAGRQDRDEVARAMAAPHAVEVASCTERISTGTASAGSQDFDRSKQELSQARAQIPNETRRKSARAHIPNETRRRLVERDGLCCSHVGEDGQRCGGQGFLQIHHRKPWAKGGSDTLDNLQLLCHAHNQLLAQQDYGASHMQRAVGFIGAALVRRSQPGSGIANSSRRRA